MSGPFLIVILIILITLFFIMAKQSTLPNVPESPVTDQEVAWLRSALELQFKSLERARSKYPPGSTMYQAMSLDLEQVRQLKEKF